MLSPASLRVCCLAVMAPALTKAVRQADCLPVVLSKTYCVSGTINSFNGQTVSDDTEPLATQNGTVYMPNDSAWYQPSKGSELLLKACSPSNDSSKPYSAFRFQPTYEYPLKGWHNADSAINEKRRLTNTMNKSNFALKNMGLAKANTSLGFQSPKKMAKIIPPSRMGTIIHASQRILPIKPECNESLDSAVLTDTCKLVTNSLSGSMEDSIPPSLLNSDAVHTLPTFSVNASSLNSSCNLIPSKCDALKNGTNLKASIVTLSSKINDFSIIASTNETEDSSSNIKALPTTEVTTVISNTPALPRESFKSIIVDSTPLKEPATCNLKIPESNSSSSQPSTSREGGILPSSSGTILLRYPKIFKEKVKALSEQFESDSSQNWAGSLPYKSFLPLDEFRALDDRHNRLKGEVDNHLQSIASNRLRTTLQHTKRQLGNLVKYYQKKLSMPCQQQVQSSSCNQGKETVDRKVELLQNEDVRNLSTAALVSLVRKLESSPKCLTEPKIESSSGLLASSENVEVRIIDEECHEILVTARKLLASVRHASSFADPDATDSSSDEEVELPPVNKERIVPPFHKRALWKWVKERSAVASRWTWLITQIHDLEFQLGQLGDSLKQVRCSEGDVCFEELVVSSESSALSTSVSDNASLQATSTKQAALKHIIKPVNGYLDHSDSSAFQNSNLSSKISSQESEAMVDANVNFCSRTCPIKRDVFHNRKLLRTSGLHLTNTRAARLATLSCKCNCQNSMPPCVLCSGRYNNVRSIDPDSMPLLDRIAILDPSFHPVLSVEKDIPLHLHFESLLREREAYYRSLIVHSPVIKKPRLDTKPKHFSSIRSHRNIKRYAGSLLSAKYRKKHVRNTNKRLRKRGLFFGSWKRLQKNSIHRVRRFSIASSCSSQDSPVPSPSFLLDDGYDQAKRRRDDQHFDIDDVIMPCDSKTGRVEMIQYKEIEIPSWRYMDNFSEPIEPDENDINEEEDASEASFIKRHDLLEIEEKKRLRGNASGTAGSSRRGRKLHRCESRADSGANTPDPVLLYQQDIVFQDGNSLMSGVPMSPAFSPPATPSSAAAMSDDSQPSFGNGLSGRNEKRRILTPFKRERQYDDSSRLPSIECDFDEYETLVFPLSDGEYEEMLKESTHFNEEPEVIPNGIVSPQSPISSNSSTSTVDEDEDITDPEWTVVNEIGPEKPLVLKFQKI